MREIKFRAKFKHSKNPSKGNWFYGFVSRNKKGEWLMDTFEENYIEVAEKSIGEYTGLKESDSGREIFEGDIIQLSNGTKGVVYWAEEWAMWAVCGQALMRNIDGKIIGNDFDNPELLIA